MNTCQTCAHWDSSHEEDVGECMNTDCKPQCKKFVNSGCDPCPFCGSGAWVIELNLNGRITFEAMCVNEECAATIMGCHNRGIARKLWNSREKPVSVKLEPIQVPKCACGRDIVSSPDLPHDFCTGCNVPPRWCKCSPYTGVPLSIPEPDEERL